MIRMLSMLAAITLAFMSIPFSLADEESYYTFESVTDGSDVLLNASTSSEDSLEDEAVLLEDETETDDAVLLGSPRADSSVDAANLSALSFVTGSGSLGYGILYFPSDKKLDMALNSSGYVYNPSSSSVSGYFKTGDDIIYSVNAPAMSQFRYYDSSDYSYVNLAFTPDNSAAHNVSFISADSPFESLEQQLLFMALLILGVMFIVK